ncbi:MAG TPA: FtsX-like permease family protein [Pyrinomonadaceae bacterium]|jgi:ABC-type transport system, involved in lipoprotein release, permease component|nr:FtsX-like permease family protein [Pyrinomonadaceae bacterium]
MALPLKYNLRNIIVRKGSTLATAFTIGLTVAVFLLVLALARGIDMTLSTSGEPLNMIVMREGSTAELNSSISRENFKDLMYLDGVEREGDQPRATGEIITLIYKARKGMTQGANVTVRGVGPMSFKLRSGFATVAGRVFQPGMTEAVVSKRISERFQGLEIGDKFRIQTTDYTVVGLFDSAGKAFESEIWVDINSLASTTKRNDYSSALLRVKDQNALSALTKRITDDPKLHLKGLSERTFYEDQQGQASMSLKILAGFISFIMAVGAGFAGMNTMYAAVARRTKEIGTLRVLGFSRLSILIAFLLESISIAVIGAAIGIVLALPLNFVSTGTSNWVTFSEIAFNFKVTPDLMLSALIFGAVIGFVGSLLPSIRASRFKIVDALRA